MFNHGYDAGLYRDRKKRQIRRYLIFIALAFSFVEFMGLPQIRIRPERKPAYYMGLVGQKSGRVTKEAPLIVLQPLKRSLVHYATNLTSSLWSTAKSSN